MHIFMMIFIKILNEYLKKFWENSENISRYLEISFENT